MWKIVKIFKDPKYLDPAQIDLVYREAGKLRAPEKTASRNGGKHISPESRLFIGSKNVHLAVPQKNDTEGKNRISKKAHQKALDLLIRSIEKNSSLYGPYNTQASVKALKNLKSAEAVRFEDVEDALKNVSHERRRIHDLANHLWVKGAGQLNELGAKAGSAAKKTVSFERGVASVPGRKYHSITDEIAATQNEWQNWMQALTPSGDSASSEAKMQSLMLQRLKRLLQDDPLTKGLLTQHPSGVDQSCSYLLERWPKKIRKLSLDIERELNKKPLIVEDFKRIQGLNQTLIVSLTTFSKQLIVMGHMLAHKLPDHRFSLKLNTQAVETGKSFMRMADLYLYADGPYMKLFNQALDLRDKIDAKLNPTAQVQLQPTLRYRRPDTRKAAAIPASKNPEPSSPVSGSNGIVSVDTQVIEDLNDLAGANILEKLDDYLEPMAFQAEKELQNMNGGAKPPMMDESQVDRMLKDIKDDPFIDVPPAETPATTPSTQTPQPRQRRVSASELPDTDALDRLIEQIQEELDAEPGVPIVTKGDSLTQSEQEIDRMIESLVDDSFDPTQLASPSDLVQANGTGVETPRTRISRIVHEETEFFRAVGAMNSPRQLDLYFAQNGDEVAHSPSRTGDVGRILQPLRRRQGGANPTTKAESSRETVLAGPSKVNTTVPAPTGGDSTDLGETPARAPVLGRVRGKRKKNVGVFRPLAPGMPRGSVRRRLSDSGTVVETPSKTRVRSGAPELSPLPDSTEELNRALLTRYADPSDVILHGRRTEASTALVRDDMSVTVQPLSGARAQQGDAGHGMAQELDGLNLGQPSATSESMLSRSEQDAEWDEIVRGLAQDGAELPRHGGSQVLQAQLDELLQDFAREESEIYAAQQMPAMTDAKEPSLEQERANAIQERMSNLQRSFESFETFGQSSDPAVRRAWSSLEKNLAKLDLDIDFMSLSLARYPSVILDNAREWNDALADGKPYLMEELSRTGAKGIREHLEKLADAAQLIQKHAKDKQLPEDFRNSLNQVANSLFSLSAAHRRPGSPLMKVQDQYLKKLAELNQSEVPSINGIDSDQLNAEIEQAVKKRAEEPQGPVGKLMKTAKNFFGVGQAAHAEPIESKSLVPVTSKKKFALVNARHPDGGSALEATDADIGNVVNAIKPKGGLFNVAANLFRGKKGKVALLRDAVRPQTGLDTAHPGAGLLPPGTSPDSVD